MKEELFKGLTDEQIAKVKACKNNEEILSLAKEEDIALSDERLEDVSGGCVNKLTPGRIWRYDYCPNCKVQGYNDGLTYENGRYDVRAVIAAIFGTRIISLRS